MNLVAWVPVLAQGLYSVASYPRFFALWRAKRSDQHSLWYSALITVGHFLMLAWSALYADEDGLTAAYLMAITTAAVTWAQVVWYRVFPGGFGRTCAHCHGAPRRYVNRYMRDPTGYCESHFWHWVNVHQDKAYRRRPMIS